jgi:nicotinate-nucleotide adenylyltransferase
MSRVGVYGGTFDPVHNGHLAVAERLTARFGLDELLFVPAAAPPHKRGQYITHVCHRFAMLALALDGQPRWRVSTIELEPDAPQYTVETIARLGQAYPQAQPLYFVMGADSFEDITSWRQYLRLAESCHIIVTARPGHQLDSSHLPAQLVDRLIDLRGVPITGPLQHGVTERPNIYLTEDTHIGISSTGVREAVRRGEAVGDLVPPPVARYIMKQELYNQE